MSLPSDPEVPTIFRCSANNPAQLWDLRIKLCSDHEEKSQFPSKPVNRLISAVTILVILSVCALVPPPAGAQAVYGSIFGTITDQSGASVVGAKVTVTSVQKNTKFETITNGAGNYNLTHLIPDQ